VLTVRDNGVGLPEDVNERKASSLGLQMVETLSRQLKGAYEFRRDGGTQFYLTFSP